MHPDLEAIVTVDEQLRARLAAAERDASVRAEAHQTALHRRRTQRAEAHERATTRDVEAILEEARALVARRASARRARLTDHVMAARSMLDRGVTAYLEVVQAGRGEERSCD